jgi:hypothetical protein
MTPSSLAGRLSLPASEEENKKYRSGRKAAGFPQVRAAELLPAPT